MAKKMKAPTRAEGGKVKSSENIYNAAGSPAMRSAKADSSDGFKRGGKIDGDKGKKRMDKRPRMASGGSPYSAAHRPIAERDDRDSGHEGEGLGGGRAYGKRP